MSHNPADKLHTKTLPLIDMLGASFFNIPENQREYRWDKRQFEKLWTDLIDTMMHDYYDFKHAVEGHFLGAIVVIGDEAPTPTSRWEVIDGQQRLTTLTILAECLRCYLDDYLEDRKTIRRLNFSLQSAVVGEDFTPRLLLNRESDFYSVLVTDIDSRQAKYEYWESDSHYNANSEVQKNIRDAFIYFFERIDEFLHSAEDPTEALETLIKTFQSNFYVLRVRAENNLLAYTLFETLNERGLELSQADLIKNSLLQSAKRVSQQNFNEVNQYWRALVDAYENQSTIKLELPQLIQFSYSVRHNSVKKEKIFEVISDDLRSGNAALAVSLSKEFLKDAKNWIAFLSGDLGNWTDQLSMYQYINTEILWKDHCTPYIMSCMDRYTNIEHLEKSMKLLESFLFRESVIGDLSVAEIQSIFTNLSSKILEGITVYELASEFKTLSSDTAFIENFKVASIKNAKLGYYVIWSIENKLNAEFDLLAKPQSVSHHLEHIMPKRPDSDWRGIENSDGFEAYLSRIGNLIILPRQINSSIKNRNLDYKLSNDKNLGYENSDYKVVREFVENHTSWITDNGWDFESISNRQAYLAQNHALNVWNFDI